MFSEKIVFLILTKNEENSITQLIRDLRGEIENLKIANYKILLIDDSTDKTGEYARNSGAEVVPGDGKGLGDAYRKGLSESLKLNPKYIVSLDGDGQVQVSELSQFITPLQNGYDLIVGSRFRNEMAIRYSYPKINFLGSKMLSTYLAYMTKQPLTDSHGGFRAMRSEVASQTHFFGNHTYVQETLIEAAEAGFKILEISSAWNVRKNGKSRVVGSVVVYARRVGPILLKRLLRKLFLGRSR